MYCPESSEKTFLKSQLDYSQIIEPGTGALKMCHYIFNVMIISSKLNRECICMYKDVPRVSNPDPATHLSPLCYRCSKILRSSVASIEHPDPASGCHPTSTPMLPASLEPSPCLPCTPELPLFQYSAEFCSKYRTPSLPPTGPILPLFQDSTELWSNYQTLSLPPTFHPYMLPLYLQSKYIHNRMWILFMNNDII